MKTNTHGFGPLNSTNTRAVGNLLALGIQVPAGAVSFCVISGAIEFLIGLTSQFVSVPYDAKQYAGLVALNCASGWGWELNVRDAKGYCPAAAAI